MSSLRGIEDNPAICPKLGGIAFFEMDSRCKRKPIRFVGTGQPSIRSITSTNCCRGIIMHVDDAYQVPTVRQSLGKLRMEFKYRVATLACHCWTVLVAVMLYCIGLRIFSFLFILFIAVICDILRARFVVDLYQSIMTSKRSLERASNDDAYAKNIAASSLATISTLNWVLFVGGIVYAAFMPRHFPFFGSMLTDDVGTLIHWLTPLGSTYSTNTSPEVQRAELSLSMFFGIWILFVFLGCAIAGTSHSYRVSHKLAYLDAQKATRSGRKLASRLIAVTFFLLFLIIFASVTRLLIAFLERSQYRDIIDGSPIGFYISMTVLGTGIISIAQRLYAYLFIYRASISRLASSPDTYK